MPSYALTPPPHIKLIAIMGLVPFAASVVLSLFPDLEPLPMAKLHQAIIGYGALTLGFLGGIRWGVLLQSKSVPSFGLMPAIGSALLGLVALLLPYPLALALLIVGFGAQGAWDVWAGYGGNLPGYYARLRGQMTWATCGLLVLLFIIHAFNNPT